MREQARELYLTGEVTSVSEIARQIKAKPHTVGRWKKEEKWDALRLKIDLRAAEQMAERLASERTNLNSQHFKAWGVVLARLFESLKRQGLSGNEVQTLAATLEKAQRGQRLARGLALDGLTEEQIRAESEAEVRALVDLVMDVVKTEVRDPEIQDRIARAIFSRVPGEFEREGRGDGGDAA